jgi:hypothetical protein
LSTCSWSSTIAKWVGVVEDVVVLLGDRVLVERDGDAAQRLRGGHRPVEPGPVVADDREVHPALEAERGEAAGERAHFLADLRPAPRLPDAEILLANRRMTAAHTGVMLQEARKGIRFRRNGRCRHGLAPPHVGGPGPGAPPPFRRGGLAVRLIL